MTPSNRPNQSKPTRAEVEQYRLALVDLTATLRSTYSQRHVPDSELYQLIRELESHVLAFPLRTRFQYAVIKPALSDLWMIIRNDGESGWQDYESGFPTEGAAHDRVAQLAKEEG